MSNVQPVIKQETRNVAIYCAIGAALMFLVFFIWHSIYPDKVPFDYTVFLGGIGGSLVALLNFFLMGLTVQKAVTLTDKEQARKILKFSYTRRFFIQIIWCVIAIFVPCFQMIAGIVPLLFPSLGIKGKAIFTRSGRNAAVKNPAGTATGTAAASGSASSASSDSAVSESSTTGTPVSGSSPSSDSVVSESSTTGTPVSGSFASSDSGIKAGTASTGKKVPITERISFNEVDE